MFTGGDKRRSRALDIPVRQKELFTVFSYVLVFLLGFLAHIQTSTLYRSKDSSAAREYGKGWHSIEVFYGKTERLEQRFPGVEWHAQVQQDLIVSRLFREKRNGFFIDLAANEAVWISNTYALEQNLHWTGLCMEPNPTYWLDLAHRKCQVVAAVVGKTRNEAVVFQKNADGAFGGIVGFDNQDATGGETRYTVPLSEILQRFDAPNIIDYLSLDVEGAETFIMQHFPFHEYSFNVMTVERPKDDLKALFEKQGYECIGTISSMGETVWVRTAYKDSLDIASVKEFFV